MLHAVSQIALHYLRWVLILTPLTAVIIIILQFIFRQKSSQSVLTPHGTLSRTIVSELGRLPGFVKFALISAGSVIAYTVISEHRHLLDGGFTNHQVWTVLAAAVTAIALLFFVRTDAITRQLHSYFGIDVPAVTRPTDKGFASIGGYDVVKNQLRTAVGHIIADKKRNRPNGLLLYGPPGCGKTFFAEKVAEEFGIKSIKVHIDDIKSMWVNQSPAKVGEMFKKAIAEQPCALIFEEMDGLIQSRGDQSSGHSEDTKVTNAFLTYMDDLRKANHKVVVIGTTNYYDRIDKAAVRRGRFDYHIKIDRPDKKAAEKIVESAVLRNVPAEEPPSFVRDIEINKMLNIALGIAFVLSWTPILWELIVDTPFSHIFSRVPNSIPTGIVLAIVMFIAIQKKSFLTRMMNNRVSAYINAEKVKQDAMMRNLDLATLASHFEGRNAADIESAISMTILDHGGAMDTAVIISTDKENKKLRRNSVPNVSWDSVIVNKDTLEELQRACDFISHYKEMKDRYTQPLKGVVLYGEPGCGKTLIARAIASNADCSFYQLKISDLVDKYRGETEKAITEIYSQARGNAPSVIFIDEAEALFGKRDSSKDNSAVNQILTEIDGFEQHYDVVFTVLATNYVDRIDSAVKSRLSTHIHISKPDEDSRKKLINLFLSKIPHDGEFDLANLVAVTSGNAARDIENLINKALTVDVTRPLHYEDILGVIEKQKGTEKPAMVKKYTWDDLIVQDETVNQLKAIENIFRNPDRARRMGIKGGINVIFSGPPGTGKTHAARVFASIVHADFREYVGGDFKKKYVGEAEEMITEVFGWLKSRASGVLYIDEAEGILMDRGRLTAEHSVSIVNQFLAELQGFEETGNNYAVIISTNYPDMLDGAVRDRFTNKIPFVLPCVAQREKLFMLYLDNIKLDGVSTEWLANQTDGFSPRGIVGLINTAKMNALNGDRETLNRDDFQGALKNVP